jgi:hypothetical protein
MVQIPGPGAAVAIVAAVSIWASVQPTDLPIWFRLLLTVFAVFCILVVLRIERLHISARGSESTGARREETKVVNSEQDLDAIRAKLNTREASTLTFLALATSASLIVFALSLDQQRSPLWEPLFWSGVLFVVLGYLYRELTVFTIDMADYGKLPSERLPHRREWIYLGIRGFLVRWFFSLPVVAWLTVRWGSFVFLAVASAGIVLFLQIVELWRRGKTQHA